MPHSTETATRMPVLFLGHGSPMNALADNAFTKRLNAMGKEMRKFGPKAILVVSAHWLTDGTFVNTTAKPETIHDFYGFPDELYEVAYPAPGSPDTAQRTLGLVREAKADQKRGLDHGSWSVLKHLFPEADIPVFQLSVDFYKPMQFHFDLAKKLASLRNEGVLVIGSGNIVHNLQRIIWEDGASLDWAVEFDAWVKEKIDERDMDSLVHYEKAGNSAKLSVPTADHYIPLLYCLSLADHNEPIAHFYEEITYGSLSMRCLKIG